MGKKRVVHFLIFFCGQLIFILLVTARIINNTNTVAIMFNVFLLTGSLSLLRRDFSIIVFRRSDRALIAFFQGLLYSLLFSIVVFAGFSLFQEVTFIVVDANFNFRNICWFLFIQLLVAFSEEAFFRVYLYEVLFSIFHRTLPVIFIVSFLFASLHILLHGNAKQYFVSLLFSLYAFYIKSRSANNNFYLLCWTHFTYNCLARFVFSI